MTDSEIEEYLVGLDDEISKFKEDLFRISWYMRGGVTIHDLMHVYSNDDVEIMSRVVQSNIENTIKSNLPLL